MMADPTQLAQRSDLLHELRTFFRERNFVEVETPLLADEVIPELHIEPFRVERNNPSSRVTTQRTAHFLQASPELHMKLLLAAGMDAIFQITRSFRAGEHGPLHREEFTIVEWYRTGDDLQRGMDLLDELCQAMLKSPAAVRTSYAEAFETHVGVCPHTALADQLAARTVALGVSVPSSMRRDDRDEWLNLLLATRVETHLGRDAPEILYDYPASQAALARIVEREGGKRVAARFELFWHGVELANGYDELTDADELRERLEVVNAQRQADGGQALPLPESLLAAIEDGLPPCAGCALGFDRLAMVAGGATSIDGTMTESW